MNDYEKIMQEICDLNEQIKKLEALKAKKASILKRSFLDSGNYGKFRFTYTEYYANIVNVNKLKKDNLFDKYSKKVRRCYFRVIKI